ncbi:MAG: trigger factor [Phycisphaerae bacterium]|nr:trigger factor [Phycisphaerae bacterium]
MDIPGAAGATESPEVWDKAQEESERLLEELKKEVKAELKDAGVLRKEMHVTVPAKIIADHMEHNYSELMHDAQVPGFRKGHAPRRLIEKRFGHDVRESLTTSIVGQSFYAAAENNELEVLGDPLFRIEADEGVKLVDIGEALQHIKLPESGDFSYVCEVELKPKFELPELKGIEIKAPEIEITDEMVDEQLLRQRTNRGRLEPVTDAAEKDDQLIVDMVLTVDGQEVKREENVTISVRPTALEGIPLVKLDEVLAGVKSDETRATECVIPPDFERADLRGKSGKFEFKIHEIKRLMPEPLEAFIEAQGYDSEEEIREHFRARIEGERDSMMVRVKRGQVEGYLLKNTQLDLPQDFSARQTERAVSRRIVELQQRGVPWTDIESQIDELRTSAREQVANDLKLGFVLDKVAEELGVHVTDEEVNTEIARIAQLYNRRFDRIRDNLQSRGLLTQLVEQIRHNKCVELLLEDAKFVTAAADEKESTKKESE